MSVTVKLYVTYQQLSVFHQGLSNPFNSWSDLHIAQGFSWRQGSVAFGTLEPDGNIEIEVSSAQDFALSQNVIRAIVVPFAPPVDANVEVATITESQVLSIPNDVRGILFEAGIGGDTHRYRVTFLRGGRPLPKVLVADAELSPPEEYLMEAEPA